MARGDTPVSQLRRLRGELRQTRESLRLTQREVAEALDWSSSKLIRIENGPVGISVTDVRALLHHYKITAEDRVEQLVEMARASKRPAWWHRYRDIYSKRFLDFLGLEASSIRMRQFQGLVMPGLLQTPDYARALLHFYLSDEERITRGVAVRMERQVLLGPDGPQLFFIVDEAVLRRMIGGPEVMRSQLRHLKTLAAQPSVSIQAIPFSAGVHKGMKSSFEIFELSDQEDDYALLLEQPYDDVLIDESSEETREYVSIFFELEKVAYSRADTLKLIDRVLDQMEDSP